MSKCDDYLNEVCREVRFRAARKYVKQELSAHIDDKRLQLEQSDATDAEAEAVKAMGDAVQTGQALNAIHRPRVEWGVIACVILLCAAGFIAQQAIYANGINGAPLAIMFSRIDWLPMVLGLILMAVLMFADYTWLIWLRHACFGVALACIAVYVWFKPGEAYFDALPRWYWEVVVIIAPAVLFLLSMSGFIQRHRKWRIRDMALLLGLSVVALFAMSRVSYVYTLLLAAAELAMLLTALAASSLSSVHKAARTAACVAAVILILAVLRIPQLIASTVFIDYGTESVREMLSGAPVVGTSPAFAASGVWSLSDGTGTQMLTSSIGAYGWLFGVAVSAASCALLILMISRSLRMSHTYGRHLALGVCVYIGIRFFFSMLFSFGIANSLSLELPFFGPSSMNLVTDSALVGVFLSVWRRSSFMPRDADPAAAASQVSDVSPAPPIQ